MTKSTNDYVRCPNCQTVYDRTRENCPQCGEPNAKPVYESGDSISEAQEPVFNLLD